MTRAESPYAAKVAATLPVPTLGYLEAAGPRGLLYPPPQVIIDGVESYLNYPFALEPRYRMLRLDLHRPIGAEGRLPVLLFAGGGGWSIVAKNQDIWRWALDRGFAVVSIEYRMSGEARFPDQIFDVKAAVRWVRGNAGPFGLDADHIVGFGCSAGGYLMSMAGATNGDPAFEGDLGEHFDEDSALQGVIAHYAPSDLAALGRQSREMADPMLLMGTGDSPETHFLGFPAEARPEEAAAANVARHVARNTLPMLLMHGDADRLVSVEQSLALHRALEQVGARVRLAILPGAGHGDPMFVEPEAIATMSDFLAEVLRPECEHA